MQAWVYGVLFVVAACAALLVWVAWRDRTVDLRHDVALGTDAERVRRRLLERGVPTLVAGNFRTAADAAHTTTLERRYIPVWTFWVAILLFPVGLIALVARNRETITIASSGHTLRVRGRCRKRVADEVIDAVDRAAGTGSPAFRPFPMPGSES